MTQIRGEQIRNFTITGNNINTSYHVYSPLFNYVSGDIVFYKGESFIAKQDVPSGNNDKDFTYSPDNVNYWINLREASFKWLNTIDELRSEKHDDLFFRGIFENASIYFFDINSTDTDDNDNIIKPNDLLDTQSGRWIKKVSLSFSEHTHTINDITDIAQAHVAYADEANHSSDSDNLGGISASEYQLISEKNQPDGYAGLDSAGKLFVSQIPAVAISDVYVVSSQTEQDALDVQTGDVVIRTDVNESFIYDGTEYKQLLNPPAPVQSVDGRTGDVILNDLYAPINHDHEYIRVKNIESYVSLETGASNGDAIYPDSGTIITQDFSVSDIVEFNAIIPIVTNLNSGDFEWIKLVDNSTGETVFYIDDFSNTRNIIYCSALPDVYNKDGYYVNNKVLYNDRTYSLQYKFNYTNLILFSPSTTGFACDSNTSATILSNNTSYVSNGSILTTTLTLDLYFVKSNYSEFNTSNNKAEVISGAGHIDDIVEAIYNLQNTKSDVDHTHIRDNITDLWNIPFWDNIPDKPTEFTPSEHTHTISEITDIDQANVANADTVDNKHADDFVSFIDLTGQLQLDDYRKSVIALCTLNNDIPYLYSFSSGIIYNNRRNGIEIPLQILVSIQKRYDEYNPKGSLLSIGGDFVKLVKFQYNNEWYGGIEIIRNYSKAQEVYFLGKTNFDIFGLDYYDIQNDLVLNQEVADSISYDVYDESRMYLNGNIVWDSNNDGIGSGLNADLLDGLHSSDFILKSGDILNGNLDLNGYYINNLADPVNLQDAATKNYVDNKVGTITPYYYSESDLQPVDPHLGDIWYDTAGGIVNIYTSAGWIRIS